MVVDITILVMHSPIKEFDFASVIMRYTIFKQLDR